MPNYYAHLKFGDRVLEALPTGLTAAIEGEREAFELGCLGPDPLFFYQPLTPSAVRREGVRMHRGSALPAVRRIRAAIEEGQPMAAGYGAGFLCHLALDSACHSYVYPRLETGEVSHMAMEGEFDRLLICADGLPVEKGAHLPRVEDGHVWDAAARVYEHATPRKMERAYRNMFRCNDFLSKAYGKRRGKALDAVSYLPACASLRGVALSDTPHPDTRGNNTVLQRLLTGSVPETAEQVAAFFDAIILHAPIPRWFDRNFKGNDRQELAGRGTYHRCQSGATS